MSRDRAVCTGQWRHARACLRLLAGAGHLELLVQLVCGLEQLQVLVGARDEDLGGKEGGKKGGMIGGRVCVSERWSPGSTSTASRGGVGGCFRSEDPSTWGGAGHSAARHSVVHVTVLVVGFEGTCHVLLIVASPVGAGLHPASGRQAGRRYVVRAGTGALEAFAPARARRRTAAHGKQRSMQDAACMAHSAHSARRATQRAVRRAARRAVRRATQRAHRAACSAACRAGRTLPGRAAHPPAG